MLYSGTDLIRTSGHQTERKDRLKIVEPVKPVENPAQSNSSLDQDTQSALMRFARFIHKKVAAKGLPKAYRSQIDILKEDDSGHPTIDIYI